MSETTFPIAAIVRVMKANGVERVGSDAVKAFDEELTKVAASWSKQIKTLAEHAGRKTAKAEDVLIAIN